MKLVNPLYLYALIVVLALSNIYTLRKWFAADAECQAAVNTKAASAAAKDIRTGNTGNIEAFNSGEQVKGDVQAVFYPIKEKVYETRYVSTCTDAMPQRVQDAVRSAVDAANGR